MCRSIRQLRKSDDAGPATTGEADAAALQYVRKISGFREPPSPQNAEAFRDAVDEIAHATQHLLEAHRDRRRRGPGPVRGPGDPGRDPRRAAGPAVPHGPDPRAVAPAADAPRVTPTSSRRGPGTHVVAPPRARRRRRPLSRQRRGPRGARPRARDAAVRLRPRAAPPRTSARSRARSAGPASTHAVRFALKACPDPRDPARPPGLGAPGTEDAVGIDACSPGEVTHALANGWEPGRDQPHRHQRLRARPRRAPRPPDPDQPRRREPARAASAVGRRAAPSGIRINPGAGAGYTEHLAYAGERPTKFGDHRGPARRRDRGRPPPRARRGHAPLPRGLRLARRPARRVRAGARRATSVPRPAARTRAARSARSTSAAGSAGPPATTSSRSTSTRTRRSSRATSRRTA